MGCQLQYLRNGTFGKTVFNKWTNIFKSHIVSPFEPIFVIVRPNFAGYYCFPDDSAEDPFRVFIIDHTSTHASLVGGVPVSELNQTRTGGWRSELDQRVLGLNWKMGNYLLRVSATAR